MSISREFFGIRKTYHDTADAATFATVNEGYKMSQQVGPLARELMCHFEGCCLSSFQDAGGVWTIGRGATQIDGKAVIAGMRISQAEADALFDQQIDIYAGYVTAMLRGAATTPAQFGALASACYNAGPGSLANSPMLLFHRGGNFAAAAQAWLAWHTRDRAGNPEPGLKTRRAAEAKLYSTGIWP